MIIVAGTLQFEASHTDAVVPHILEVMKETLQEKGCICYRFARSLETVGLFQIYEEWDSEEDLNRHLETDHIAVFLKALAAFTVLEQDIKVLEAKVLRSL